MENPAWGEDARILTIKEGTESSNSIKVIEVKTKSFHPHAVKHIFSLHQVRITLRGIHIFNNLRLKYITRIS